MDLIKKLSGILVALLILTGCSSETADEGIDEPLKITSTFSIMTDMVEAIGGEHVEVYNLVPLGTDPHEYDPKPEDIQFLTDSDALFYNGFNLEGENGGWLDKFVSSVNYDKDKMFRATDDVKPMYLAEGTADEEINPHSFIDPNVGIKMAEVVKSALIELDEENSEYYKERGEDYINELKEIENDYRQTFEDIPDDRRILIASEFAFQYLTEQYNIQEGYIWAIDTEENGSPQQIKDATDFVKKHQPPVLFVESNVDRRPMEAVSKESGVPIYDKPLYSDEIGNQDSEASTYLDYLRYNLNVLSDGMNQ
ncbi:metal ABC transporter substrate-binding protein [Nosocomiicoccus ampullae]|uniref:metal ABC transporter substrate-binding protein n=1 Tax=Nosocomiicoccus ampullae TaxID=489910 RepID=UPI001C5EC1B2|nr:zinc ABC transporter substrate-binding protein [Nosocomiicoccus ampullae]QYA48392.1 zinc ABC transporter substrate-binding protein [Nosocomiicoccus ampullae]